MPIRALVCFAALLMLAACTAPARPAEQPPVGSSVDHAPAGEMVAGPLSTAVLFPTAETEVAMGRDLKVITQVKDADGREVSGAEVVITVRDGEGKVLLSGPAIPGQLGVYRSDYLPMPRRVPEGQWTVTVEARKGEFTSSVTGAFKVKNGVSERLYSTYGFWIDEPSLVDYRPEIFAERGDARAGLIRYGAIKPGQHVFVTGLVEIHWREGDFVIDDGRAARRFILDELGDIGFSPIRELRHFKPFRFKEWEGWRASARGEVGHDLWEWIVFYAPEANKTYAIGTLAVTPPRGSDPHAILRSSFEVAPEGLASGESREPLPDRLPGPTLLGPVLGTRFAGVEKPITLKWKAVKETLAEDEYYEVMIAYDFGEGKTRLRFATRETHFTLPESLYHTPNCQIFNWRVTLMRQKGVNAEGEAVGEALSHRSLYWYVWWQYPAGEKKPWIPFCPNPQI